ncbi:trehalose-phosphatase [Vibrio sp.]|uniref:Trehalose 6-phosphate phosphatase n=1 Tax=Vibrio viridaestus TaxID=2487322 RepID=A0A3N9TE00_9VIBR|nr:trehalose-phosphatase [Vibrio viridaestus]MDC0610413.1 trehalose-phosphatase [Vibrio sp.]RQW62447.1 trehalose-phosphatase [Vibrio viridaestus]
MHHELPNLALDKSALFFDFDGTLVDLKPTPDEVVVSEELQSIINALDDKTSHAIALISGRNIESLDKHLQLPNIKMSGSHGMEYRLDSNLPITLHPDVIHLPDDLINQCESFCEIYGLLLERKPLSLAIHYRSQPTLEPNVIDFLTTLLKQFSQLDLKIQSGKCIREIKPSHISKATALDLFANTNDFKNRTIWYFGDDVTDEDAFEWVNAQGGVSVKIGEGESKALYRLPSPNDLKQFLLAHLVKEE